MLAEVDGLGKWASLRAVELPHTLFLSLLSSVLRHLCQPGSFLIL